MKLSIKSTLIISAAVLLTSCAPNARKEVTTTQAPVEVAAVVEEAVVEEVPQVEEALEYAAPSDVTALIEKVARFNQTLPAVLPLLSTEEMTQVQAEMAVMLPYIQVLVEDPNQATVDELVDAELKYIETVKLVTSSLQN
jgi:hypothetical protein